ncbi:YbjN domain-containing protein [Breznakiella homolactica]|uniref:Molecular chaperone Tir n=1 Tax=Breznakiella homolactica TaxID=2798577 RepID=A0A7T8BBY3_9SPIR|nr:YbjN domain-containing protein [Breznakiella homolactica]QQO09678.1 YbjN domain-containing protein [Breznakiella homolactica]
MQENKVEQYLIELMYTYREIEKNMWLIDDEEHDLEGIVVMYTEPLVIIRAVIMDAPQEKRLEFFTKLLELNANDVLHGAYALEEDQIVLIDTLEYNSMDFTEFRATLDAFSLALTQHYPILSKYRAQ